MNVLQEQIANLNDLIHGPEKCDLRDKEIYLPWQDL